jgi:NAD(P)-dependent dehydrogenase (short-subunit alcohol dehydrogenase family)
VNLQGKVALITGAGGGIGLATARAFAQAGAELVLSDTSGACDAIAEALAPSADRNLVISADLGEAGAAVRLARAALAWRGRIDVLVCAAGVPGPAGSMSEVSAEAADRVFEINLRSVMHLTSAIAPAMAEAGAGSVVLVASIAGIRGNKAIGVYGMTKAALAQLARNLAIEWGPCGVRANAVSPGLIRTAFAASMLEDRQVMERRLGLTPLRRAGEPQEVASAILFLASEAASFVTGHNLVVDGGTVITDGN